MSPRPRPTRPTGGRRSSQGGDHSDDDDYRELIEVVREMIDRERLHVPPAIDTDPVDLPFDLTEVSDARLQKLFSAFASYSYRAGYLLMLEEAKGSKCRDAADELVKAFIAHSDVDFKTVTAAEAAADQIDDVKVWRKRQRRHGLLADALRKERDNYDKVCDRLSRLETMRHDEFERAGNKLSRRPSAARKS